MTSWRGGIACALFGLGMSALVLAASIGVTLVGLFKLVALIFGGHL